MHRQMHVRIHVYTHMYVRTRAYSCLHTVAGVGTIHVGARLIAESNRGSLRDVQVLAVPEHGIGRARSTSCKIHNENFKND